MPILDALLSNVIVLSLLGVGAFISRKWIIVWIAGAVRHDFDVKLATVQADIRAREQEIKSLRDSAIANATAAQGLVLERRLKAVDDIWSSVADWQAFTINIEMIGRINFEEASRLVASEPGIQKMTKTFSVPVDRLKELPKCNHAQPYVSDLLWALYSAYTAVFVTAILKANLLADGLDASRFWKKDGMNKVLIAALPDWKDFIVEHGDSAHHLLIDTLRQRMLVEIRKVIAGNVDDQESVNRAAAIVRAVSEIAPQLDSAQVDLLKRASA